MKTIPDTPAVINRSGYPHAVTPCCLLTPQLHTYTDLQKIKIIHGVRLEIWITVKITLLLI